MANPALGTRAANGDWRPPYTIDKPIFMSWPLKPGEVFKFFFAWPGYLWPWNAFFFAIPLVSWFYLTPSLASMQSFELWWVGLILARNLALTVVLCTAWHLWFYVFKVQGDHTRYSLRPFAKKSRVFTFNNQLADNIFWTLASGVPIWTAYEVVSLWLFANGFVPFVDLRTNPVWFVVFMLLIPLIRDFHFYAVHRLLHWRPLYELAHCLHHRNVTVGPWAGMSMHPVEHVLYFSGHPALDHSLAPAAHDVPPASRGPVGTPGPPRDTRASASRARTCRSAPTATISTTSTSSATTAGATACSSSTGCSAPGTTAPTRPTSG